MNSMDNIYLLWFYPKIRYCLPIKIKLSSVNNTFEKEIIVREVTNFSA